MYVHFNDIHVRNIILVSLKSANCPLVYKTRFKLCGHYSLRSMYILYARIPVCWSRFIIRAVGRVHGDAEHTMRMHTDRSSVHVGVVIITSQYMAHGTLEIRRSLLTVTWRTLTKLRCAYNIA